MPNVTCGETGALLERVAKEMEQLLDGAFFFFFSRFAPPAWPTAGEPKCLGRDLLHEKR